MRGIGSGIRPSPPIQAEAIPPALTGRDVIASAQTGSGKTRRFCQSAGGLIDAPRGKRARSCWPRRVSWRRRS
jgi:ATP-dependent RNA helicase RhlE